MSEEDKGSYDVFHQRAGSADLQKRTQTQKTKQSGVGDEPRLEMDDFRQEEKKNYARRGTMQVPRRQRTDKGSLDMITGQMDGVGKEYDDQLYESPNKDN